MPYVVVIAGLNQLAFDRVRKESSSTLAPGGSLVMRPLEKAGRYTSSYIDALLTAAHAAAKSLKESEPFQVFLLYVDFEDAPTQLLLERFFPFCLPMPTLPLSLQPGANKNEMNAALNQFTAAIVQKSQEVRRLGRVIADFTSVANLTPLLLPRRNFREQTLDTFLRRIYGELSEAVDPAAFLRRETTLFLSKVPLTKAPGATRHCFSDGHHFFQSPGKNRHGYFRNSSSGNHSVECLLNARSRLGGHYSHAFHYDCLPVKGSLQAEYDNCHCHGTPPKDTHVNIAPNDYIV